MAGKKKNEGKGSTYDLDAARRLETLTEERKVLWQNLFLARQKLMKSKRKEETRACDEKISNLSAQLEEVDKRIVFLSSQAKIVELGARNTGVQPLEKQPLEAELANAYCSKCSSPDLKITKIIKIECRKCGRERMITSRLDTDKK